MIQRIQSLYLLLGSIAVASPLLFSTISVQEAAVNWFPWVRIALSVLAALLALVALVGYGNRKRQSVIAFYAQICVLLLLMVVVSTTVLYGVRPGVETWTKDPYYLSALILPSVAYILFGLARRAIRKDVELVKSMDRLRD
ncbi:MAG: DUF4293 family protein [Rhodothermales bacterium]|nr:DUF4293 family protein [Rhodothermales bacterium]